MRKKCLYEKLNDQKGAAAVITLSVILLLTALGTIALVVSTMSVRMSGKTVTWSDEYYSMDSMAEKYIHQIDAVIANAEKDARIYVQYRLDRIDPASPNELKDYMVSKSLSFTGNYDYDMDTSDTFLFNYNAQHFFHEYYKYDWIKNGSELTLDDYQMHKLAGDLETISQSYAAAIAEGTAITIESAFEQDLNNYISQLFDRVYYHMMSIRLLEYTEGYDSIGGAPMTTTQNVVLKGGSATYGHREPDADDRCTYTYTNISYTDETSLVNNWNVNKNPSVSGNSIGLYIRIQGGTAQDPKQVRVDVDVTLPDYQTVTKYVHTPLYGNPLLTNALSVQGSITFDAGTDTDSTDVQILGDVYSSGSNGISTKENANINIRGNVYTPGDLKIVGSNSKLSVDTALTKMTPALSYDFKEKTYGNEYLYDFRINQTLKNDPSINLDINEYAPGGATDRIPLVFHDRIDQGNVYCNSVFIGDEAVEYAEIDIKGNLWTKDDIQLDGVKSAIRIGTTNGTGGPRYNYIGLSMESGINAAGGIDHEASSSIINNYPFDIANGPSSEIVLNSNIIVPGVAFYEFNDGANDGIYASVESVTSRTSNPISLLNAYLYDPANPTDYDDYTNQDNVHMNLIRADLPTKRQRLIDFVRNTIADPEYQAMYTNIRTDLQADQINGYIAGVALIDAVGDDSTEMFTHEPYAQPGATALIDSWNNFFALGQLSHDDIIKKIFYSKTKKLGTAGRNGFNSTELASDTVQFSDFIDTTVNLAGFHDYEIKVINPGGTLNVNAVNEGIVYCSGDLTITSEVNGSDTVTDDAVFRGTIICAGNVTIKDDVKLVYDEFVILKKLKSYFGVRGFFENISATYFTMNKIDEEDIASTSGQRNVVKRLRIKSWRELPVSP